MPATALADSDFEHVPRGELISVGCHLRRCMSQASSIAERSADGSARLGRDGPQSCGETRIWVADQKLKGRQESPSTADAPNQDVTEQIAKLASLHAQGILTDAEFADKK